ncbi:MAG: UDP-N-acetylmuramate--L-alanine ligase [Tannerellaceae bacterium]|jgi:UDP-N-acetylmuramate--alanine ligase|nr:UDP-N-acetylmuramate--L-alanine ligase [Tannerellaceae bacterium]
MKVIISGGGTGGHIFPAIAIAGKLTERYPGVEILFVGAEGRMEMKMVPDAGYHIVGIPVSGISRTNPWKALKAIKTFFITSRRRAKEIILEFKPDIVVGTGGYASSPVMWAASALGIPFLIQEQNSFPGITNRLFANKAAKICVAYKDLERYFPAKNIVLTGNPVRHDIENFDVNRNEAFSYFGLSPARRTLLIIGGSLGAREINYAVADILPNIIGADVQLIWQAGSRYIESMREKVAVYSNTSSIWVEAFITRMDYAYAAADLVISRAGAGTISELTLLGKPAILVPSPNVTANHQTKNALAVGLNGGAVVIHENKLYGELVKAVDMIKNNDILEKMSERMLALGCSDSAGRIVNEIDNIIKKSVYFIGIGGIGMSALVRYYLSKGKSVGGYDRTASPLTESIRQEGAEIHYEDSVALIPEKFRSPVHTLIIYTPAVPDSHRELCWFRENGFEIIKRSEALGRITATSKALCIAGTHGKTTTSSMVAHLLKQSTVDCTAFLGGILKNYNSNLLLSAKSEFTVVEADEYDRSFHCLTPYMAVITSADEDHLDIYGTGDAYRESFAHFSSLVVPGGTLVMKKGININPRLKRGVKLYTYSTDDGDFHAGNICISNGEIHFDFIAPDFRIDDIKLGVPVRINIENAVAAIAIATLNGVSAAEVKNAMATFGGSGRRFDIHINNKDIALIDDYAHHPSEIRESIRSVKELYAGRRLTVVFQPHLYSRTRDFAADFAEALSLADELILLDIYPAREEAIPGITSQIIFDRVTAPRKTLCTKDELVAVMKKADYDVVLMAGAGDIDRLVKPVKEILLTRPR